MNSVVLMGLIMSAAGVRIISMAKDVWTTPMATAMTATGSRTL